jgi:hypothetical protein
MMTLSRGFRSDAGTPEQTATHVAAAALIVTTVPTAMRAGTAAPASAARASTFASRSGACGSASPLPMKHFNVPRAADGPARALANIAARTLEADGKLMETRGPKGRPRPNGGVGEGMAIMADGVAAVCATAGLVTGLSRRRTGAPDRQRRAPPAGNLRQATELAPYKDRTRYARRERKLAI